MSSGQAAAVTADAQVHAGAEANADMVVEPVDCAAGGVADVASDDALATIQRMEVRIGELERQLKELQQQNDWRAEQEEKKELALRRAMLQVMRRVGGMDKDQDCGPYKFRGIDQIYQGMHSLLLEAGLFLKIETLKHSERECVVNTKYGDKPGRLVSLNIRYTFCHELGGELSSVISAEAVGADDKVMGKAQSYAYKRLMFDTFCIPFKKEMPDESNVEMNVNINAAALARYAGKKLTMESGEADEVVLQRLNILLADRFDNDPMLMARHMAAYFAVGMPGGMDCKKAFAWCQGFEDRQLKRYLADTLDREIQLCAKRIATSLEAAFFADYGAIARYQVERLKLGRGAAGRQELFAMCQATNLSKLRGIAEHIDADLNRRLEVCGQVRRLRERDFRRDDAGMLSHLCAWLNQPVPAGNAGVNLKSMLAGLDTERLADYAACAGKEIEANDALRQKLNDVCVQRFNADSGMLAADMARYFQAAAPETPDKYSSWLCQFTNGQLKEYLQNFPLDDMRKKLVERCMAVTDKYFGGKLRDAMLHVKKHIGSAFPAFSKMSVRQMELWLWQVDKEMGAKAQLIRICDRRFGGDRQKLLADLAGFLGQDITRFDQVEPAHMAAYIEAQKESMSGPEYEDFWDMKEMA